MGNWRNRPRFYRKNFHRSPPRSWYSDRHSSSSGYGKDDGVPPWEKRFCESIGSVPWQKVVEFNNFKSWYQGKVTSWNASACEEAFHNAKTRFWSEMNGLPCDVSLPDPDMYIDEIEWNAVIDPELINDLEQEHSAVPFKGCNEESDNPWEGSEKVRVRDSDMLRNELQGWNLWESYSNNKYKDSNNCENPWECDLGRGNEAANNATWGAHSGRRWEDNGWENDGWGNSRWRNRDTGNNGWKNGGRGNNGWDKWGHQNKKTRNFKAVPYREGDGKSKRFKNPWEDSREVHCSNNSRNKSQGWNLWESSANIEFKDSNNRRNPWEANRGCGNGIAKDDSWGDCSGKGWDKCGDNSPGSKWQDLSKQNGGYNPWCHNFMPANGALRNEACGNDSKQRKWKVKRLAEGWENPDMGSLKREGFQGYHSNYRNSRFKRDDNRTASDWRNSGIQR